jgi:glutamine---fructose-6-phosphate transaminase (isomerizing)
MCGIAGYVGPRQAEPILLASLGRLEYRGYDSWGISVLDGKVVHRIRRVGRLSQKDSTGEAIHAGQIGIGHTRWATHGKADLENAHPLVSCDDSIHVVHNGVIENCDELRRELEQNGHIFRSKTDSEVIVHLLEEAERRAEGFDGAFARIGSSLRGSYAILAVKVGLPEVYLVRKGSPLVVGVGDGEYFPASDIPSFLPETSHVLYVPEDQPWVLSAAGVFTLNKMESAGARTPMTHAAESISLTPGDSSKGSFDHFMIKEILEQVSILQRFANVGLELKGQVVEKLRSASSILFVGAGTSYHAAMFGKGVFAKLARLHVDAVVSSEFEHVAPALTDHSVVIALTQSGETADTLGAARLARECGADVIGVTNVPESSLGLLADHILPLDCGPEISVAATKSYTAQLATLLLLAHAVAGSAPDGPATILQARDILYNLTADSVRSHLKSIAERLTEARDVFLLGRGSQYVTALEGALKLKEVSGVRAEAFPGGEMKHGPLSLVYEGTPVMLFYEGSEISRARTIASELASRGARIYTVGGARLDSSDDHIKVDDAGIATPLVQIVPMQILAYELAKLKLLDPDHPRNLAKSVTVA